MSQEGYSKQQLVAYRLERAKETLQDAQLLLDQGGSPGSVVNRSYYAMLDKWKQTTNLANYR